MKHWYVSHQHYMSDDATYVVHTTDFHSERGIELSVEMRERRGGHTLIIREAPDNDVKIEWGPPLLPLKGEVA